MKLEIACVIRVTCTHSLKHEFPVCPVAVRSWLPACDDETMSHCVSRQTVQLSLYEAVGSLVR